MGLRQSMPAAGREGPPPPPPQPSYWQMIKMGYAELVGAIIRPPRAEYTTAHLGPPTFEFCGRAFQRRDFDVVNGRGQRLRCSHWEPVEYPPLAEEDEDDDKKEDDGREGGGQEQQQQQQLQEQQRNPMEQRRGSLPCIVYMHGNSSARMEALPQLSLCLSLGITMVALDFAGSGHSDGDFVSLGYYEKDDLKAVIEYLRASGRVSRIALWGRSMGAVTALMHGERDPSLAAMILDSPFADFVLLADEMVDKGREHGVHIPRLVGHLALRFIKASVQSKAGFDIRHLRPLEQAPKCFMPALFIAGRDDDFIDPSHARKLAEVYGGDKNMVVVEGDHNSMRPRFLFDSASIFLQQTLQLNEEFVLPGASKWLGFPPWAHLVMHGDKVYYEEEEEGEEGGRERGFRYWEDRFVFDELGHLPGGEGMIRGRGSLMREEGVIISGGEPSGVQHPTNYQHSHEQQPPQLDMGMTQGRQREIQNAVTNLLGGARSTSTTTTSNASDSSCMGNTNGASDGVSSSMGRGGCESRLPAIGGEEWSCALCTLVNDGIYWQCDACGAARPGRGGSSNSSSSSSKSGSSRRAGEEREREIERERDGERRSPQAASPRSPPRQYAEARGGKDSKAESQLDDAKAGVGFEGGL